MPLIACPGCDARLNTPDGAAGKAVRCPKCQAVVRVPAPAPAKAAEPPPRAKPARPAPAPGWDTSADDDRPRRRRPADADDEDDDRPRPKRKKRPAQSGAPVGLLIGLAAVVVALGGGGFAAYWFGFREKDKPAGPPAAATDRPRTPLPKGWELHSPPGCGFRAAFPAPPVEDVPTSKGTASHGADGRMYRSPAGGFDATPSRVLCGVGRVTLPAGTPPEERRVRGMQAFRSDTIERAGGAQVLGRRAAPVGGHPGEEVVVEIAPNGADPRTFWVIRSAAVETDVVVMAVWKEHERTPTDLENAFFDSFEITGSPVWPPPPPLRGPVPTTGPPAAAGMLLPTKTVPVDETELFGLSLSPDGVVVALSGLGRKAAGAEPTTLTVFYNLNLGQRVGAPIDQDRRGTIARGGRTMAYRDGAAVFVRELASGQQTRAADAAHFAFAPDGDLLVTAARSKIAFRPWPPGGAPVSEVETGAPVHALSRVYQEGTRVAALHYAAADVVVRVYDTKTGQSVDEIPLNRPRQANSVPSERLFVAEDGKTMTALTDKGASTVWDLRTKVRARWTDAKLGAFFGPVGGGRVWHWDSQLKLDGGAATDIRFIAVADAQAGGVAHRLQYPAEVGNTANLFVECTPDGRRFVSLCDTTRKVYIWDLR